MTLNIAIDGPCGAGKSTIAKLIAKNLGIAYLDTGAMYRALAYYAIKNGVEPNDEAGVLPLLDGVTMDVEYSENGQKVITGLKRVSKPGLRVYVGAEEIPQVLGGLGIAILSTSRGIMTGKEAKKLHQGGEVLAYVW